MIYFTFLLGCFTLKRGKIYLLKNNNTHITCSDKNFSKLNFKQTELKYMKWLLIRMKNGFSMLITFWTNGRPPQTQGSWVILPL